MTRRERGLALAVVLLLLLGAVGVTLYIGRALFPPVEKPARGASAACVPVHSVRLEWWLLEGDTVVVQPTAYDDYGTKIAAEYEARRLNDSTVLIRGEACGRGAETELEVEPGAPVLFPGGVVGPMPRPEPTGSVL